MNAVHAPSLSNARPRDPRRPDAASSLGPRLRAIRLRRGLGLRELARRLDLSPSAISRYENGKMQPSVRTLYAFASELHVTVDEVLFGGGRTPDRLGFQRADERPRITLESGVTWKRLMLWPDEDVEFVEATYEPGGGSCPDESLVSHDGHEFGHVLSGTLRVVVGFDELLLGPGDSVTFPSTTPHRVSNDGTETVRAIWVVRRRGPQVST